MFRVAWIKNSHETNAIRVFHIYYHLLSMICEISFHWFIVKVLWTRREEQEVMHCKKMWERNRRMKIVQDRVYVYRSRTRVLNEKKGFESGSMVKQVLTKSSFVREDSLLNWRMYVTLCSYANFCLRLQSLSILFSFIHATCNESNYSKFYFILYLMQTIL